jgi:two-component system LytT family response regulator
MKALRVLLADDEPIALRGLERLLRESPGVEVVRACRNGDEALEAIVTQRPDVAFLDIAMPGMSGVTLVRALEPRQRPAIVFVTAFDRFAIDAFDLHAVDYLLKPFDEERFATALARVRERLTRRDDSAARLDALLQSFEQKKSGIDRLAVKDGEKVLLVPLPEVDWFEAQDNYVRIHAGARRHLVRMTMRHLERQLDGRFARIHRSVIVNLEHVRELKPLPHGEYQVLLANGTKLTLSRSYREAVLARVGTPEPQP